MAIRLRASSSRPSASERPSERGPYGDPVWICADGTRDKATLKANACGSHGGVKADPVPTQKR